MITDPIGDLLTRIRNAAQNKTLKVSAPYSKIKEDVVRVLKEEGYVSEFKKEGHDLIVTLAYSHRKPIISGIKNVSKPGLRIYRKSDELPRPLGGVGISIVSTPKGIMSNKNARKQSVGGEVLGIVW